MERSIDKAKMALIAPLFFGYYKDIMYEAEQMGFSVDYICDAPSNSSISKAIGRINKRLIRQNTEVYFKTKVLPLLQGNRYDCVLMILGMTFAFSAEMVKQMRALQPQAKFVAYQWDSEENLPYCSSIHPYFDALYTFDRFDALNPKYSFLPLFYNRRYEEVGKETQSVQEYDCMYVGTAHPKKYYEINRMSDALGTVYKKQFIYHYMPSVLKYVYHKLLAPEYKKAKLKDFKRKKLSFDQIIDIMKKSGCVLDSPQGGQRGLTIRTIECIGAKKKLITVNEDIVNYDFYRPSNVLVFKQDIDFDSDFFTKEYEDLPEEIYNSYSLRCWLRRMTGQCLHSQGGGREETR